MTCPIKNLSLTTKLRATNLVSRWGGMRPLAMAPSRVLLLTNKDSEESPKTFSSTMTSHAQHLRDLHASYRKPTLEEARSMPLSMQEIDNGTLVGLAEMNHYEARKEMLKRHIMCVENISYDEAEEVFQRISDKNKEGYIFLTLPYQIGIVMAMSCGMLAIPMVFDLGTAKMFVSFKRSGSSFSLFSILKMLIFILIL